MTKFRKLGRPAGHRMSMLSVAFTLVFKDYGFSVGEARAYRDNRLQEIELVDYTRMLRTRIRVGDAAPMAYIEFIDRENGLRLSKPATPQPPQRVPLDPWARSRLTKQFAPPKEEKSSDSDL